VRVDVRDLAPGETLRAPFEGHLTLHSDGQPTEAQAHGEVRIDRTGQGVRLRGRIEAQADLVCSRCLLNFTDTLAVDLDEEFALGSESQPHGGELGPQDFVQWVGPDHRLDVTEVVRQHLQIAVPMAPLHRLDCRGLCPVCGANWNERICEHVSSRGPQGRSDL
jgi:uncharacterized protein